MEISQLEAVSHSRNPVQKIHLARFKLCPSNIAYFRLNFPVNMNSETATVIPLDFVWN